jgi:hypothetical protein
MKNTIKSIVAVTVAPILLSVMFHSNQIKVTAPNRTPAVETKVVKHDLKSNITSYLVAVSK